MAALSSSRRAPSAPANIWRHICCATAASCPPSRWWSTRETARRVRYDENLPFAQDTDFAIRLFLAGCKFVMAEEPGAVWHDSYDPDRTSAGRKGARLERLAGEYAAAHSREAYHGAPRLGLSPRAVRASQQIRRAAALSQRASCAAAIARSWRRSCSCRYFFPICAISPPGRRRDRAASRARSGRAPRRGRSALEKP